MTAATKKSPAARAFAEWEKNCAILAAEGALAPQVYKGGCGRCGGDLEIRPYFEAFAGRGTPNVKTINVCSVCRVDRVKRWSDLMQQSAHEGRELRQGHLVGPERAHRGSARILQDAGLVQYVAEDCAWELTAEGLALLRRADGARLACAIEGRARVAARGTADLAEWDARIDDLRKAGAR